MNKNIVRPNWNPAALVTEEDDPTLRPGELNAQEISNYEATSNHAPSLGRYVSNLEVEAYIQGDDL